MAKRKKMGFRAVLEGLDANLGIEGIPLKCKIGPSGDVDASSCKKVSPRTPTRTGKGYVFVYAPSPGRVAGGQRLGSNTKNFAHQQDFKSCAQITCKGTGANFRPCMAKCLGGSGKTKAAQAKRHEGFLSQIKGLSYKHRGGKKKAKA